MRAETLLAVRSGLAEGPVWLEQSERLAFVDILEGRVVIATLEGSIEEVITLSEPVGAVCPTTSGELVVATPSGLRLVVDDFPLVAALPGRRPQLRMNDGKADAFGRFVGGTMTMGTPQPGAGSLWSFDGDQVTELVSEVTISNGLCWSVDGATMYYIDTPTQRVDVFDYDAHSGFVSNRRTLLTIDSEDGSPDGMTIDVEGGIWVALWGGGQVRRYLHGQLDEVVKLTTPFVTCPAFAGTNFDHLVITTASEPFGDSPPPGAGDVYVTRPGIRGMAPLPFRLDGAAPPANA
jgi:sugar lactone lactonase YvrE